MGRLIRDLFLLACCTIVAAVFMKSCVADAYKIPSASMEKTLRPGDCVIVNKCIYGSRLPRRLPLTTIQLPSFSLPALSPVQRNDVIVFESIDPVERKYLIKRCVGVPGDLVEIKNKNVYVNGTEFLRDHSSAPTQFAPGEGYTGIYPAGSSFNPDFYGPIRVPADSVFVLGDNLDNSYDSRFWGFAPLANVVGRAECIYWSSDSNQVRWDRIGTRIR